MSDDEDWIMRPVIAGKCFYESLIDGKLDLSDIARINEAIDVQQENQARIEEAMRDKDR